MHFFFFKHALEIELEDALYEIISRQAKIILSIEDLGNDGELKAQLDLLSEYDVKIEECNLAKRRLYERLLLRELDIDSYRWQKALTDAELHQLTQVHSALAAHNAHVSMDSETKSDLKKLAYDVSEAHGITSALTDALIERINTYTRGISWKSAGG